MNFKKIGGNGARFNIWEGDGIKEYPKAIKEKDKTYHISTVGKYCYFFDDIYKMLEFLMLNIVTEKEFKDRENEIMVFLREIDKKWNERQRDGSNDLSEQM